MVLYFEPQYLEKSARMSKTANGSSHPAYDYLLEMILNRQLMPGDKIPEVKIAKELGISRTPVREAMRRLANDGLIEIFPNRFAKVTEFTPTAIRDIGVLRIALDTTAVKLAGMFSSRADCLHLKSIAQKCIDAFEAGNIRERWLYDTEFHMELARMSRNEILIKFQTELYLRVRFILAHHINPEEDEQRHLRQHLELADALMDHDDRKAREIVIDQLSTFYNLRDSFPDSFFDTLGGLPLCHGA